MLSTGRKDLGGCGEGGPPQEALGPSLLTDVPCDLGHISPLRSLVPIFSSGNAMKVHSVLQTGVVMCRGHDSIPPSVAKGRKATRGDSGPWHRAWPPKRLGGF